MKKLNIQVYEGSPDEIQNKDNNNIFITGDIEYNDGGTKISNIKSIKDSNSTDLISVGGYYSLAGVGMESWGSHSGDGFPQQTGKKAFGSDDFSDNVGNEFWLLEDSDLSNATVCHINVVEDGIIVDFIGNLFVKGYEEA